MARLAAVDIQSDEDDFPSLKELARCVKGVKGVRAGGSGAAAAETTQRSRNREAGPGGNRKFVGECGEGNESNGQPFRTGLGKGKAETGEVGRRSAGKKKRVLRRVDDNPLLRPIGKVVKEEQVTTIMKTRVEECLERSRINIKGTKRGGGKGVVRETTVEVRRVEDEQDEEEGVRRIELETRVPSSKPDGVTEAETKSIERWQIMTSTDSLQIRSVVSETQAQLDDEFDEPAVPEIASTRTRVPSADLSGASDIFRGIMKSSEFSMPSSKPKPKSAPITIDSDDDVLIHDEDSDQQPERKPSKPARKREARPKTKSKFILTDTEEEDSPEDEASDGMSDFIVSDNEPVEDGEDDDSIFEVPPPATRSARKLFRGRKPQVSESEDEELGLEIGRLRVDDDDVFGLVGEESRIKNGEASPGKLPAKRPVKEPSREGASMRLPPRKEKEAQPPSSDVEDPFTLRFSPSENKRKVTKETRFTTPPGSPKLQPRILPSPAKLPRIPTSPHRQSSDAFWSQDVVNDWNDEYSPRKTPKPTLKPLTLVDGKVLFSPRKSPIKPDRLTKDAKKTFSQTKHDLTESFLKELDEKITDGKIAELAASTGGVRILWSKKLNTTAGRANWKRETIRSKSTNPSEPSGPTFRHHAAIELAEKVIDEEDRLLNVIAHEFCHLANFMVSEIRTNPHGKEFKAWAAKVSREFGHRGIEVTTKHSYEIDYKYIWECENCGTLFKRHSKSIDPVKHRCGVCKSKLLQTKPVPRSSVRGGGMTGYQSFVKEHMKAVREENPGSPQKEIMRLVGKRYQEFKAAKLREGSVVESGNGEVGSKESTPVDDVVGDVVRKLDFLDLTSP